MKLGISTSSLKNRADLFQIFTLARSLELDVVEIVLRNETVKCLENHKNYIKKLSEDFTLLFHPYDIELNKIYFQLKELSQIIMLADYLNIDRLLIHPGFKEINYDAKMMKVLSYFLNNKNKKILIENGYKSGELLKTIEEQINCIESLHELGCEDVYLGFDVWRDYQVNSDCILVEKHLEFLIKTNFLKEVHLSDVNKSSSISLPLGEGDLNIGSIMRILEDFNEYVILEVDSQEDALKSMEYLHSIDSF